MYDGGSPSMSTPLRQPYAAALHALVVVASYTLLFTWLFAQPIVTTEYLSTLPPHRTPLPGVFLANMAHVYPQDRGQNYSLRLGERMARMMLDV